MGQFAWLKCSGLIANAGTTISMYYQAEVPSNISLGATCI